jgi:hypothetical protein
MKGLFSMTQADSVLSTPPINTPTTRRRFLSASAGLAAGGAAAVLAISPAGAAHDPIFALIEKHKALDEALAATFREKSRVVPVVNQIRAYW